jgi:hypothetical protein
VSTDITTFAVVEPAGSPPSATAAAPPESGAGPRGAVYRILPDGEWDTVWESNQDTPFDIAADLPGGLLIGTGGSGKIFQLSGEPVQATLVTRVAAQQVVRLFPTADGQLVAVTANPGKVFGLSQQPATEGTYFSEVRDAETVATWGTIRWHVNGSGTVAMSTRSGNTATPDDTWSEWSPAYRNSNGDPIVSPKARYLQWRAVLNAGAGTAAGPVLTSVTTAYLPRNRKPAITAITVHPPGTVFQRPYPTGDVVELAGFEATPVDGRPGVGLATLAGGQPALGRRLYQKGLQTVAWTARDADDDALLFDVLYQRDDDTEWKMLRRHLWEPILTWDTTSLPDGTYTIKVVASDASANAPESAATSEAESESFDIDNTPPRIEVGAQRQETGGTVLAFVVQDAQSAVTRVEYSVDAERWRVVYPMDGLPDSRVEQFELLLDADAATRTVILRATDAMRNVATATGGRP